MEKRGNFYKKGTISVRQSLTHVGMLALAALVLFLLFSYVSSIRKNSDFEMLFFSRDLALLANTIYSAPGDVEYRYSPDKLSIFNYEFKPEANKNYAKVKFEGASKSFPYAPNSQQEQHYTIEIPKAVKFVKKNDILYVSKDE